MVRLACTGLENVEILADGGMLIDLVDRLGTDWIIKGIRNEEDYRYEQCHALWNRAHNPRAETLYLPTDPTLAGISSTLVRAELAAGRVPEENVAAGCCRVYPHCEFTIIICNCIIDKEKSHAEPEEKHDYCPRHRHRDGRPAGRIGTGACRHPGRRLSAPSSTGRWSFAAYSP